MEEKTKQLTSAQQNLVAENHNLIYGFAKSRDLNLDEYYDILAIGLCKAGILFDPSRGCTFSTLAYKLMQNECFMYWRNTYVGLKKIPQNLVFSYDSPVFEEKDDRKYADLINDLSRSYQIDTTTAELKEFIESLSEQERLILYYSVNGYTQLEMSHRVGLSQSYISRVFHKIRDKWQEGSYKAVRI